MEPLEQQLSQIQAITCSNDRERHTQVLQQTNGNVQAALDILFSDPAVPAASPLGPRTVGFRAPRGLRGITRLGMGLGWAVYSIVLWPVGIVWGVLVGGWRFLGKPSSGTPSHASHLAHRSLHSSVPSPLYSLPPPSRLFARTYPVCSPQRPRLPPVPALLGTSHQRPASTPLFTHSRRRSSGGLARVLYRNVQRGDSQSQGRGPSSPCWLVLECA